LKYPLAIILGISAFCLSVVSADPVPYHRDTYPYVAAAFLIILLAQALILFLLVRFAYVKKVIPLTRIVFTGIICTAFLFACFRFLSPLFLGNIIARILGEILIVIGETVIIKMFLNTDNMMAITCSFLMTIPLFLLALCT
jgi:hypothetical protein